MCFTQDYSLNDIIVVDTQDGFLLFIETITITADIFLLYDQVCVFLYQLCLRNSGNLKNLLKAMAYQFVLLTKSLNIFEIS